jgi:hypothetical protein
VYHYSRLLLSGNQFCEDYYFIENTRSEGCLKLVTFMLDIDSCSVNTAWKEESRCFVACTIHGGVSRTEGTKIEATPLRLRVLRFIEMCCIEMCFLMLCCAANCIGRLCELFFISVLLSRIELTLVSNIDSDRQNGRS